MLDIAEDATIYSLDLRLLLIALSAVPFPPHLEAQLQTLAQGHENAITVLGTNSFLLDNFSIKIPP